MTAGSDHEGDGGWPPRDHWTLDAIEERKKKLRTGTLENELMVEDDT